MVANPPCAVIELEHFGTGVLLRFGSGESVKVTVKEAVNDGFGRGRAVLVAGTNVGKVGGVSLASGTRATTAVLSSVGVSCSGAGVAVTKIGSGVGSRPEKLQPESIIARAVPTANVLSTFAPQ